MLNSLGKLISANIIENLMFQNFLGSAVSDTDQTPQIVAVQVVLNRIMLKGCQYRNNLNSRVLIPMLIEVKQLVALTVRHIL